MRAFYRSEKASVAEMSCREVGDYTHFLGLSRENYKKNNEKLNFLNLEEHVTFHQ